MPQIPQSYDFPANNHSQSALTNNPVSEKQKVLRDAPSNKKDEGSKKKNWKPPGMVQVQNIPHSLEKKQKQT